MTLKWKGDDENGYIGHDGNQIYSVTPFQVLRRDQEGNLQPNHIVYWMRFLDIDRAQADPEYHATYSEQVDSLKSIRASAEAIALCEADCAKRQANGSRVNIAACESTSISLDEALAVVKRSGYRVSKPKSNNHKDRVGPTFVAKFADGVVTRMSTFTSLEKLDWDRGVRLSQAAYESRWRMRERVHLAHYTALIAPAPPAIVSAHFEQDGKVLAHSAEAWKADR
jgi:hypothetical protein